MLDKNSKKILKLLNSFAFCTNHYSYVDINSINYILLINENDLLICLNYLMKLELIEQDKNYNFLYRSTIKGLTYFKDNINAKVFTILIAVISSLISSLITLIITILSTS